MPRPHNLTPLLHCSLESGDSQGKKFRIFSVHLQTTGLFFFSKGVFRTNPLKMILKTMKDNRKVRLRQAIQVRESIEASDCPVLVAGDFNSLPLTQVYSTVRGHNLTDAFHRYGKGKGATYRALKDIIRIDYIMPDRNFEILDCKVLPDFVSDHRMVVSTLRVR